MSRGSPDCKAHDEPRGIDELELLKSSGSKIPPVRASLPLALVSGAACYVPSNSHPSPSDLSCFPLHDLGFKELKKHRGLTVCPWEFSDLR